MILLSESLQSNGPSTRALCSGGAVDGGRRGTRARCRPPRVYTCSDVSAFGEYSRYMYLCTKYYLDRPRDSDQIGYDRLTSDPIRGLMLEPDDWNCNSIILQHILTAFGLIEIVLRCTLTMMKVLEIEHWNSIMKQRILAMLELVGIALRCTLTMGDFQGLMTEPDG
ncbi:hypothetical protein EVAR_24411_1 [Eumeta japonica]|uniref:Uncharacterized protein n=1 Tax=Eumeta variegata TaxID=151549 RepID=A0A4C1VT00_EUMVA|nr:hypothetical protein EVAR_24411_1 [Eumeta japonica]